MNDPDEINAFAVRLCKEKGWLYWEKIVTVIIRAWIKETSPPEK